MISFLSSNDIYQSYIKYYKDNDFSNVLELNLNKQYDIKDVMDDILIKIYFENRIIDTLFSVENRLHLIYIFLAILELYKDGKIIILNGEIRNVEKICKYDDNYNDK